MKNQKPHIFPGLLTGIILILINVILVVLGYEGNTKVSWIASVINVGMLIYFIREHGNKLNNTLSFGELFSFGFRTTAIVTIMLTVFMIIYSYAFPESENRAMEIAREKMMEDERLNEDTIEQAISFSRKFYFPVLIAGTIFGTMIVGAVGSLLGAAITKKVPSTPFDRP
jgi:hypothetical protein